MTAPPVTETPVPAVVRVSTPPPRAPGPVPSSGPTGPVGGPRPARVAARDLRTWLVRAAVLGVLTLASAAVVVYPMGPLFETRAQLTRTDALRRAVGQAYGAAHNSLAGAPPVTRAPLAGTPVALLQIPRLAEQQAVAEGAGSDVLRGGVGHAPGTAGPGQPGNSVLVGRRAAFGGPLGALDALQVGDQILCLTTQGQSVYVVSSVTRGDVADEVYDPSSDDRLTVLTSDSAAPWNSVNGVVVTATMRGSAFVPTPQNGFAPETDGRHGDSSAWALLVLEVLGLALAVGGAVLLYRWMSRPLAFLVSTPPLMTLAVFLALTGSRLLPGWM